MLSGKHLILFVSDPEVYLSAQVPDKYSKSGYVTKQHIPYQNTIERQK